jgi:hypothetical protein
VPAFGWGGLADGRQDITEHAQQPLGLGAVGLPQRLQVVTALLVDHGHPLAEHRHHVVADPGPDSVDEAHDQRQPLILIKDLPQVGDIGDPCFPGEVRDLPRRDALQPRLGRPERVDVGQQLQPLLELAQRRRLRHVLRPVELAAPRDRVRQQEPGQPGPAGYVDPGGGRLEEGGVHLGTDRGGHRVQRRVPGQLAPRPDRLLQCDVDQVGRVVLGLDCLADGLLGDLPDPGPVVGDLHPGPDELPVPLGRPVRRPLQFHVPGQSQGVPHVPDHRRRHVLDLREVAQPLVGLQPSLAPDVWLALAGFTATGLGLANLFPATIARAGLLAGSGGVALASTLGYSGFLLGPPAIGFLAGEFGLRAGLTTLSFLALAAAAIAYLSRDAGGP